MLTIEHSWEENVLKVVTDSTVTPLDFEDALIMFEELEDRLADMETRAQELDEEHEQEYLDTERYLTRIWYE